ncbi:MAG: TonB-dependent receptor [Bacteroidales bacterium]
MKGKAIYWSLFLGLLLVPLLSLGQQTKTERGEISGKIIDDKTGEPLFGVVAVIAEYNIWYLSTDDGAFVLKDVPAGKVTIGFQRIGLKETQVSVELQPGQKKNIGDIKVSELSLQVEEVVITAKENPNRMSTSSVIEKQAIDHIQASSLGDIMQLLPGQAAVNPDLNSANQASLRTSTGNSDDEKISAMGTAVIMDGAPISNNANLQASNTAKIGAEGYFSTVTGGGVDLRQISADNIESVEIVRGIPSVKHGDLTSGAIIVNTKAGVTPFEAKIKVNPNSQQAYVGKGFKLKGNAGSFNADFDYAHSQQDLRTVNPSYTRMNLQLTHSVVFFDSKLMMTNKVSGYRTYDMDRDKDGASLEKRFSEDIGFRFNNTSKLQLHKPFSDCINLSVALDYRKQESYSRSLVSGAITALPFMMVDSTYVTQFLPSEYYTGTYIDGKPLNLFASLDNRVHLKHWGINHRVMFGVDWKTDVNFGKGRYFDSKYYASTTMRPRSFSSIPAVNQFSAYLEDRIFIPINKKMLKIQAGLRFDNVQPETPFKGEFGETLLPRINASYDLFKWMTLRGGYGITSKAPALVYLYPDAAYIDATSYSMYSNQYPDESLAVLTTKVINPYTGDMRPSEMVKIEFGADFEYKKNTFNFNVFKENLTNGYGFKDVMAAVPYPVYEVYSYLPGGGQPPVLDYINVDTAVKRDVYKIPVNSKKSERLGLEFTLNTVKLPVVGTQVNITGAWTYAEINDESNTIYLSSQYFKNNTDKLVGVYPTNGYKSEQFVTTVRFIQHIPQFRFIASLAVQMEWVDKSKTIVKGNYPVGYYDTDGNYTPLTEVESHSDAYSFLVREFDETYYYNINRPALWCINLKLTKEINDDISFSFYSNNMFMNHPAYRNKKEGTVEKRNPDLYFGAELNFKF